MVVELKGGKKNGQELWDSQWERLRSQRSKRKKIAKNYEEYIDYTLFTRTLIDSGKRKKWDILLEYRIFQQTVIWSLWSSRSH